MSKQLIGCRPKKILIFRDFRWTRLRSYNAIQLQMGWPTRPRHRRRWSSSWSVVLFVTPRWPLLCLQHGNILSSTGSSSGAYHLFTTSILVPFYCNFFLLSFFRSGSACGGLKRQPSRSSGARMIDAKRSPMRWNLLHTDAYEIQPPTWRQPPQLRDEIGLRRWMGFFPPCLRAFPSGVLSERTSVMELTPVLLLLLLRMDGWVAFQLN